MKDPPGQGESVEGGSATRRKSHASRTPELVALVREAEVEGGTVAAGRGRKGKRAEYRCAACGYGIIVYGQPPSCPMCREPRWEHVEWRPFSQLLDFPLADLARSVGVVGGGAGADSSA
jgi:hypothetical protein